LLRNEVVENLWYISLFTCDDIVLIRIYQVNLISVVSTFGLKAYRNGKIFWFSHHLTGQWRKGSWWLEEAEDIKGMPFSKPRLMDLHILPIADKIIAYYDDNLYFWGK
jgi:hypothetical protein